MLCATLANCHRDPERQSEPFAPAMFYPELGEHISSEPSDREVKAKLKFMAAMASAQARVEAERTAAKQSRRRKRNG